MTERSTSVEFIVEDESLDAEGLDSAARELAEELSELEVLDVRPLSGGTAPPGTRGGEIELTGTLIALLSTPGVVIASIELVKEWLSRRGRGAVTLKIGDNSLQLDSVSSSDREKLIDTFVQRSMSNDHE